MSVNSEVLDQEIPPISLSDAIEEFTIMQKVTGKWTKKTVVFYEKQFGYFTQLAPAMLPDISTKFILEYLDLIGRGKRVKAGQVIPSPHMKHAAYRALHSFFNWCIDPEHAKIARSPINFKLGRPDEKVHNPPGKDHLRLLLDSYDDSFLGKRNKALIMLYANTGSRLSEILADKENDRAGLQDDDINWKEGTVTILGKGRKEREPGLSPNTLKAMLIYKQAMFKRFPIKQTTAFFVTEEGRTLQGDGFRQSLKIHCRMLGLNFTPHDFRRYLVTSALEADIPERIIMETTGHKSRKMLDVYSKSIRAKKARESIERHSPVAGL